MSETRVVHSGHRAVPPASGAWHARIPLFFLLLLLPQLALAHSPIKGIGDFLNGMLHPLLVPAQVLVILALGLWYGQNRPAENTVAVLMFLLATSAGLVVSGFSTTADVSVLLLAGAMAIGLVVISGISLPRPAYAVLGVAAGCILGLDSAQPDLAGRTKFIALFGSGIGIYFLLLYAMALSESLTGQPWQRIAVRVLASWLSASAMMVLALGFSR